MEQLRGTVARNEEEKQRLEAELVQVKEMLQREVARADVENRQSNVIIAEYKQVHEKSWKMDNNRKLFEHYALYRSVNVWRTTTMSRNLPSVSYG